MEFTIRLLQSLIAFVFLPLSFAIATAPSGYSIHETRDTSDHWVRRSAVIADTVLSLRIGLTQSNLDQGHGLLMDMAHPESPNYGRHWTYAQVHDFFAPSQKSVTTVIDWLLASGIDSSRIIQSENKGWLALDVSVKEAETLLHTRYYEFESRIGDDGTSIGCDAYYLPIHIQPHVDYIKPGVLFSRPLKRRSFSGPEKFPMDDLGYKTNAVSECFRRITPKCIRELYKIPEVHEKNRVDGNAFGMFEQGDEYSQSDLNLFFEKFAPHIRNGTHPIVDLVDRSQPPGTRSFGYESALDFQVVYPLIYPQDIKLFQVDDNRYTHPFNATQGQFNTWLDAIDGSYCTYKAYGIKEGSPIDPQYPDPRKGGYKGKLMCGVYKPTNVVSISYGLQEISFPENYQRRQCNEFMKLGLQGSTLLVASGDFGVAAAVQGEPHCLGQKNDKFNPTYPDNCPYITSVGATRLAKNRTTKETEVVASFSGGGFSNLYPTSEWQKSAVHKYLTKFVPPYPYYKHLGFQGLGNLTGIYNRIGRAMPDLAANGEFAVIINKGKLHRGGGTSQSTPIVASIISRINEERLRAGKKPVGFINPALYHNPSMFNDVTEGHSFGCHTKGFPAAEGWDPVSGLGTPNYPKMLKYFLSLP